MIHQEKTLPKYFEAELQGVKNFDVRADDREPRYSVGDLIVSMEWDGEEYTGRAIIKKVTYILREEYCLPGYCIMSTEKVGDYLSDFKIDGK